MFTLLENKNVHHSFPSKEYLPQVFFIKISQEICEKERNLLPMALINVFKLLIFLSIEELVQLSHK